MQNFLKNFNKYGKLKSKVFDCDRMKKRRIPRRLFFYKTDDITDLTIENIAKCIQCFSADCFTFFHAIQGVGGEAFLEDQVVFRDTFFKKCLIKWLIADHGTPLFYFLKTGIYFLHFILAYLIS